MVLATTCALALLAPTPIAQQWVELDGPIQHDAQASFDPVRNRLVVLGTEGGTWEFDGKVRLRRENLGDTRGPARRYGGSMATDTLRGLTLLFGGSVGTTPQADAWTWDGSRWSLVSGGSTPPARRDGMLAFDSARDRFVLYGGGTSGGLFDDTWEFDGSSWAQVTTAHTPSANVGRMVYDSDRGVCVLLSSPGALGVPMRVHEYDGLDWTARPPSGAWPTARSNMTVAYDEGRRVTVMIGGTYSGEEIWEWNGAHWTLSHTLPAPWRSGGSAHYDPELEAVVVVGGRSGAPPLAHTDAHRWDGVTFAPLRPDHSPPTRYGHVLFADSARGELVMSGGTYGGSGDDTWAWDGHRWRELDPAARRPVRSEPAFTYDSARGLGLVFGGFSGGSYFDDFFAWDGSTWFDVGAAAGPGPRSAAGMSFDVARGVAVLFGGGDRPLYQPDALLDDTWEWDGSAWSAPVCTTSPSARERPAMAFDEARGVTVLFGGRTGPTAADQLDDTWEWDGVDWREVTPAEGPPALLGPCLVYDRVRERVVLIGTNFVPPDDPMQLWEFDGSTWTPIASNEDVIGQTNTAVWDDARGRITMYDGRTVRVWTGTPASASTYGTSCGSQPVPMVRTRGRIGAGDFGFEARVAPGKAVIFVVGLATRNTPVAGGCTLLVRPDRYWIEVADAYGIASLVLPARHPSLYPGMAVYGHVGVVDSTSPQQLGLSAGMWVLLGD